MTDFWKDSPRLGARLAEVESAIADVLRDPSFPLAAETAEIVLSNGKMLRPALVLIGAGFGPRPAKLGIIRVAAALELLHAATLIHDDVLDDAHTRRGIPALHTRFGTTDAILAGDWLFSRCFRLVADSADPRSAQVLARLVGSICSAEIRQDLGKFDFSKSVRDYFRTIAGKTAALFALALHVGATEAKVSPLRTQALRRIGYDLGMAFQIIDDILDYESDPLSIGKPVGNDLKEGLATLPLIRAMETDGPAIGRLLARIGPGAEPREVSEAVDAVVKAVLAAGGHEKARKDAARFTGRARRELARLPGIEARRDLSDLLDRLLARTR